MDRDQLELRLAQLSLRVEELERLLRFHMKDQMGRAGLMYPHPTLKSDLVETPILWLGSLTADPLDPKDGQIWYRDDLGQVRVRANGTTYSINLTAV